MPTRPTTPEQKQDAKRLESLFNEWIKTTGERTGVKPSQEAVAATVGISQSALSQRLRGKMAMSRDFATAMAKLIGCEVPDFSPTLGAEIAGLAEGLKSTDHDEFAQVRRVDVSVSAGHGALVVEEYSKSALTFRRSFLQEIGVTPHSAVIVTVKGRSMEPTIRDGAVLLVSTSAKTVVSGEVYAFRQDGHLYVKRMHRQPDGGLLAVSDNPDREAYPDMAFTAHEQDFEIIGRALWMGSRL